jgi:hypothetical protein
LKNVREEGKIEVEKCRKKQKHAAIIKMRQWNAFCFCCFFFFRREEKLLFCVCADERWKVFKVRVEISKQSLSDRIRSKKETLNTNKEKVDDEQFFLLLLFLSQRNQFSTKSTSKLQPDQVENRKSDTDQRQLDTKIEALIQFVGSKVSSVYFAKGGRLWTQAPVTTPKRVGEIKQIKIE